MEFYYHEIDKDVLIIRADGGLNASTSEQFIQELERLIDAGLSKIIVDCTGLSYISSYGLGVLIRLHKRLANRGGDVKLAGIDSALIKLLSLVKLDQMFSIYSD